MNPIPSMDRHIQQTNDRLQCIKQVSQCDVTCLTDLILCEIYTHKSQ